MSNGVIIAVVGAAVLSGYGIARFRSGRLPVTTVGRAWAYVFLTVGLGLSFAANIAAAYVIKEENVDPSEVELALAGAPPIIVFGMIEVIVRNPRMPYWLKWTAALCVAVPAAVISYIHLVTLAMDGHTWVMKDWVWIAVALLTPLMVDGLLGACTGALISDRTAKPQPQVEVESVDVEVIVETALAARLAEVGRMLDERLTQTETALAEKVPALVAAAMPKSTELPSRNTSARRTMSGERKRYPLGQHPKYPDWEAARMSTQPWTVEDMQKALGPGTTFIAARSMLNRWEEFYVAKEGERRQARRNGSESVVDADAAPAVETTSASIG